MKRTLLRPFALLFLVTLVTLLLTPRNGFAGPRSTRPPIRKAAPFPATDPNIPPPPPIAVGAPEIVKTLGIYVGTNIGNLSVSPKTDTSAHIGLLLGAGLEFQLHPMFFLEPELLYVQKGAVLNSLYLLRPKDTTVLMDYLEIPLLVKSKFDFEQFRLFGVLGPSFSFLLGSSSDISIPGYETTDAKINIGKTDIGLVFGGGIEIPISRKVALALNGRYELGLSNVGDNTSGTYKNRGVHFLLGSLFQF